jgi:hypothetical protein
MRRKDLEIREFARLQGAGESKGWVKWGEILALSLFLAGCVLLVTHNLDAPPDPLNWPLYQDDQEQHQGHFRAFGQQRRHPGYSPGGWMEYTVWKPEFTMTAYVNGKPYSCQSPGGPT